MEEKSVSAENFLEGDLERLRMEIKEKSGQTEALPPDEGKKIVKESLRGITLAAGETVPSVADTGDEKEDILPDYLKGADEGLRQKVEELISYSFKEGIEKASLKAKSEGPFILDAFHDALVEKLYPELIKKGIIKE